MPEKPLLIPKHRLEALADGIFAIAMTILVLEVKVPELVDRRSSAEFLTHLLHSWPTLAAYFFSFFMLGLFWVWHHRLAAKLARLDTPLLALNLLFLALVSFFPFAAAVLGRYPANPASLMVYLPTIGLILMTQVSYLPLAMARGLVDPEIPARELHQAQARNLRGCTIFFLGTVPSAMRMGPWSVALSIAAGLGFLVLTRRYQLKARNQPDA
jgi:uncharacterized membrane protein